MPVPNCTVRLSVPAVSLTLVAFVHKAMVGRSSSIIVTTCVAGDMMAAPDGLDRLSEKVSLPSYRLSWRLGMLIVCVAPLTEPAANDTVPLTAVYSQAAVGVPSVGGETPPTADRGT